MLADTRRARLLAHLNEQGSVEVTDLVEALRVSEMTVRRDLAALEQRGLLRRVRGGAILPQGRSYEPPFALRRTARSAEKERIAEAAAELVSDGDSITLDVGTTTLALARRLAQRHNLTVLTSSLHVARVFEGSPTITVVLSGGTVRPSEGSLVGHVAASTFAEFNVDKLFLGVGGVHPVKGLTEYNSDDAAVKRTMLEHAKDITVLADASKLNRIAFVAVAPLSAVHRLITDESADADTLAALERQGLAATIATGAASLPSTGEAT